MMYDRIKEKMQFLWNALWHWLFFALFAAGLLFVFHSMLEAILAHSVPWWPCGILAGMYQFHWLDRKVRVRFGLS